MCFLFSLAALVLLFAIMCVHARVRQEAEMAGIARMAAMVREVGLTDLCLFTEASYTRNPSQTDLQAPFQEHPVSLEHFPSGSIIPPPEHQKDIHAAIH
jgi:hypothetical protein